MHSATNTYVPIHTLTLLRHMIFSIHDASTDALIESYTCMSPTSPPHPVTVNYTDSGPTLGIATDTGHTAHAAGATRARARSATVSLLRGLTQLASTLDPLDPDLTWQLRMKLCYRRDITPPTYTPPYFGQTNVKVGRSAAFEFEADVGAVETPQHSMGVKLQAAGRAPVKEVRRRSKRLGK